MRRSLWIVAAAAVVAAPLGWMVSDALESQNSFCTSCHLDASTPLHAQLRRNFESVPAVNLASAHFAHDQKFRCIDCHRGASFPNRVRVKLLAMRDAAMYLTGRFEEPREMKHPLWKEDCTQCHAKYEAERDDAFHADRRPQPAQLRAELCTVPRSSSHGTLGRARVSGARAAGRSVSQLP